ncbi:MAG: hypothetical protein LC802_16310 [Acidobacteria bacterium]|nr:hypothetical protein [Acidobacteriota bacterium]
MFTFRHLADPALDNPWTWFFYDIEGVRALKEGRGNRTHLLRNATAPVNVALGASVRGGARQ